LLSQCDTAARRNPAKRMRPRRSFPPAWPHSVMSNAALLRLRRRGWSSR
jgi:hypothetical protein